MWVKSFKLINLWIKVHAENMGSYPGDYSLYQEFLTVFYSSLSTLAPSRFLEFWCWKGIHINTQKKRKVDTSFCLPFVLISCFTNKQHSYARFKTILTICQLDRQTCRKSQVSHDITHNIIFSFSRLYLYECVYSQWDYRIKPHNKIPTKGMRCMQEASLLKRTPGVFFFIHPFAFIPHNKRLSC